VDVAMPHFFLKRRGKKTFPECYFLFEEKVTKENFPESNPASLDESARGSCDFSIAPKNNKR
jgi:hypothetical protein